MDFDRDDYFMSLALKEAKKAFEEDEVPVGAVLVYDDRVIGKAHNQMRRLKDPTAHAEMIAISQAAATLGEQFLRDCCLYVTLEPCIMCAGAIGLSRIERLVFALEEPEFGGICSRDEVLVRLGRKGQVELVKGIMRQASASLLKDFFKKKRVLNDMERWLSG